MALHDTAGSSTLELTVRDTCGLVGDGTHPLLIFPRVACVDVVVGEGMRLINGDVTEPRDVDRDGGRRIRARFTRKIADLPVAASRVATPSTVLTPVGLGLVAI